MYNGLHKKKPLKTMKNTLQGGSMGFFRVNTYLVHLVFARPYENV